eukprot:scaffold85102_cov33-Tisochrysis_lutea.AAC.1
MRHEVRPRWKGAPHDDDCLCGEQRARSNPITCRRVSDHQSCGIGSALGISPCAKMEGVTIWGIVDIMTSGDLVSAMARHAHPMDGVAAQHPAECQRR